MVSIIVPVYRGYEETKACIESVLRSTNERQFRLIVINDCSPEAEVVEYLKQLSENNSITVLHNEENLGFIRTVNLGMNISEPGDVILLNSDTIVSNDWIDRIVKAAYSDKMIGTVTPFSNNATICSYPKFCQDNILPAGESMASLDQKFAAANKGKIQDIPTAVGFCMYIKRKCLQKIGLFDADTFGKGYGEENEFCMRAYKAGWRNVIAADVFVWHSGGVSFAGEQNERKREAEAKLSNLYPEYDGLVAEFVQKDELKIYRNTVTALRYRVSDRQKLLYITHSLGGGVACHISDLVAFYGDQCIFFALRPGGSHGSAVLEVMGLEEEVFSLEFHTGEASEDVINLLKYISLDKVHVHHMIGHDVHFIKSLVQSLCLPFDFTVHDYFVICPQIFMSNNKGKYCGEKGIEQCEDCVRKYHPSIANGIWEWRSMYSWLIDNAEHVICPSNDVVKRIHRYFLNKNNLLAPHLDLNAGAAKEKVRIPVAQSSDKLSILVLGASAEHKGVDVVYQVGKYIERNNLPIKIYYYGDDTYFSGYVKCSAIDLLGPYKREDIDNIVQSVNPHLAWVPSTVPETYSYVLDDIFHVNLPVVVSNIGALPERVKSRPATWVISYEDEPDGISAALLSTRTEVIQAAGSSTRWIREHDETFYRNGYLENDRREQGVVKDIRREGVVSVAYILKQDACGYIRAMRPGKNAEQHGIAKVLFLDGLQVLHVIPDVIVIQRCSIDNIEKFECIREHCVEHSIKLFLEIDDDLINMHEQHIEYGHYLQVKPVLEYISSRVDGMIVSTPELGDRMRTYNSNIFLLSNYLDLDLWRVHDDSIPTRSAVNNDSVRICYIGGNSHKDDLRLLESVFRKLKAQFKEDIEIDVIGLNVAELEGLVNHVYVPPSVCSSYPQFVRWLALNNKWDIGLAPLIDTHFNRAKSPIKYLDYTALGLCSICSRMGVYDDIVDDGENGFLASDDDEWYEKICVLIKDKELRHSIANAAKKTLVDKYSIGANLPVYKNMWKTLAKTESSGFCSEVNSRHRLHKYWEDLDRIPESLTEILSGNGLKYTVLDSLMGNRKENIMRIYHRLMRNYIFNRLFSKISPEQKSRIKKLLKIQ